MQIHRAPIWKGFDFISRLLCARGKKIWALDRDFYYDTMPGGLSLNSFARFQIGAPMPGLMYETIINCKVQQRERK